jgi:hypothetical protein
MAFHKNILVFLFPNWTTKIEFAPKNLLRLW